MPIAIFLEWDGFIHSPLLDLHPIQSSFIILFGSWLALVMIFSEYLLVKESSSITMGILGITKELTTILISVFFLGDYLSPINIVGLLISILGLIAFNYYKYLAAIERETADLVGGGEELIDIVKPVN